MSILQVDGITFGNTTQLNSFYGIIPQNTNMAFYQASAPTGWTQYTGANDLALRVVDGAGGGGGGSLNFSTIFTDAGATGPADFTTAGSVGDYTLVLNNMAEHSHNAGSQGGFAGSGGSSPFRIDNRQPRGYNVRKPLRVQNNNRVQINFRAVVQARQPRTYPARQRQPFTFRQRVPFSYRQRRDARQRREFQNRIAYPFSFSYRARRNFFWRIPFNDRYRQPRNYQFRSRRNRSQRRLRRNIGWTRWRAFYPTRVRNRRFVNRNVRRRENVRTPWPSRDRQPRTASGQWRGIQWVRSRLQVRYRQPRSARQRRTIPARNRIPFTVSYRAAVPTRIPASYRQPRQYRVIQRYPTVYNVRVVQRVLTPGGTIRSIDQGGPATSSVGGGQAHTHPFTGDDINFTATLSPLRVQYVDVILCTLD